MTDKQYEEIMKENKEMIKKALPDKYTPIKELEEQTESYTVIIEDDNNKKIRER